MLVFFLREHQTLAVGPLTFGRRPTASFLQNHTVLYIFAAGDELVNAKCDPIDFFNHIAYYNSICAYEYGFVDSPPTPFQDWVKQHQWQNKS